jgi:hypothetical protein
MRDCYQYCLTEAQKRGDGKTVEGTAGRGGNINGREDSDAERV